MSTIGQMLIIVGLITCLVGFLFLFGDKVPFLGKLPGDIYIDRGNVKFYFPLATCLLISLILTIVLSLFKK